MSERPKFTATDRGSLWRSTIVDTVSILGIPHNTLRFSRDAYISDTDVNTDEEWPQNFRTTFRRYMYVKNNIASVLMYFLPWTIFELNIVIIICKEVDARNC